jgi:hypothetical protein
MSDTPPEIFCPELSTIQVLVTEVMFTAQSQAPLSLQGIQGLPGASAPPVTNGKAVFVHQHPVLPEGTPSGEKIEIGKIERFRGQPNSAPCMEGQCAKWCAKHEQRDCAAGCKECMLEIQTRAFAAALAAQGQSLGLAAASRLLNKAHENYEEHQETQA